MQLSKQTFEILKNFAMININLVVREGNIIRTQNPANTIVAQATVEETFPKEFGIYELNDFLGAVNIFKEANLSFESSHLQISGPGGTIEYRYSPIDYLSSPPNKSPKLPPAVVEFTLDAEDLERIIKSASVLKTKQLIVRKKNGKPVLILSDVENDSKHSMTLDVDLSIDDSIAECELIWEMQLLRLIYTDDYTVSIAKTGHSWFKSEKMFYIVGLSDKTYIKENVQSEEEMAPWE